MNRKPLDHFEFQNTMLPIAYIETMQVINGVECDVYRFIDDFTKDLGMIYINPGTKTPLQKVLKGDSTIEGYISGKGKLVVTLQDGMKNEFHVDENNARPFEVKVEIGQKMQWQSDPQNELVVYEICYPPYKDGRYENIEE